MAPLQRPHTNSFYQSVQLSIHMDSWSYRMASNSFRFTRSLTQTWSAFTQWLDQRPWRSYTLVGRFWSFASSQGSLFACSAFAHFSLDALSFVCAVDSFDAFYLAYERDSCLHWCAKSSITDIHMCLNGLSWNKGLSLCQWSPGLIFEVALCARC